MTVTPYCANLFQDCQDLRQFLLTFKQTCVEKDNTQIVSISQKIPSIDPLAVLDAIALPDQLHFYFEKPAQGEAIAAIDTATSVKLSHSDRFSQAQKFINSCLAKTSSTGTLNLPFSGPHFFCSFTFFDDNLHDASPFPAATIFLPRWQISSKKNYSVVVANIVIDSKVNYDLLSQNICEQFQAISSAISKTVNIPVSPRLHNFKNSALKANNNFKASVVSALESINRKHINKIVLSDAIDVTANAPFNLVHSLNNLRIMHPDCYVFSTSNGKGQNFIGASPERLIKIHNRELETDALAGSAPRGKTAIEDAYFADGLLTSEKERHEHRVVSDFIIQRLSKLGLNPQRMPLPLLLKLSNIQHLWTPIRASVPAGVHPLEIVAELHPTPAVAGDTREIACKQIRRYESFNRCLYAAPLGWVNHRGDSEFIVGIRSALIDNCRARLYAGAGIVAGSDPDKELAEIQLKLQALLKALV